MEGAKDVVRGGAEAAALRLPSLLHPHEEQKVSLGGGRKGEKKLREMSRVKAQRNPSSLISKVKSVRKTFFGTSSGAIVITHEAAVTRFRPQLSRNLPFSGLIGDQFHSFFPPRRQPQIFAQKVQRTRDQRVLDLAKYGGRKLSSLVDPRLRSLLKSTRESS